MRNSAVISNWCIDAFDCLSSKLYKKLSFEQISRVEAFISSVILFDEVFVSENYVNNRIVLELSRRCEGAIKTVAREALSHSTDMTDHISIDVNLHVLAFEELAKENDLWQIQHDPGIGLEIVRKAQNDLHCKEMLESKFLTQLRLWHWCYTNEMAEITNSINVLPLSLGAVSEFAYKNHNITDAILKGYLDYALYHNQRFVRVSETLATPFVSEVKSIPPLMSVLLSRCKSSEDMVPVLAEMRCELIEFRVLRHEFTGEITKARNIGEQEEIVSAWNKSWEVLSAGEFKKPSLLKRKISSTDVSTSVVSIESGSLKTILKNLIDHHQYKKAYKQFQIYSQLHEQVNSIELHKLLLGNKFGVESIIPFN
ncbi:hypothetical protein J8L98_04880 [Pseudoalteromonas sp. MMG013]|uniref:hypothetical protein n=1 Tax=Pseudoalteromonas sp. MMG013 TaxID=2822687 RepID=UPI001B3914A3|nr:hypothetical protein [Pseudoalteromonas sp. MMG013]MBQ4861031.1 hypothetical protein [Pseudoalteromonas sp. MMG013]